MIIIRLIRELNAIGKEPVVSTKTDQIFIRALKLFSGISIIIDDIFLYLTLMIMLTAGVELGLTWPSDSGS